MAGIESGGAIFNSEQGKSIGDPSRRVIWGLESRRRWKSGRFEEFDVVCGMRLSVALAFVASLVAGIEGRAELALDVAAVEVKPKAEDETVTVSFTFRNTGDKPVTVLNLESGCSCLSSSLDARTYAPGASGTGKAEFKVSSFVGRHEKSVTVTTDDTKQPQWVIPFILDVPAVVEIEPKTLQWWLGDAAVEKTCVVKMVGDKPMKITNVSSTRESVEFKSEEIMPGREYRITVKPKSTEEVVMGALKIETDSEIPKYQRQLAFFSVFRKPANAAEEKP